MLLVQTPDQVKAGFNSALINSDGAKLRSVLSARELNGATAKACTSFLTFVTKPRIGKVGSYGDQARTKFTSILDAKSPMTVKFRPTGGADIHLLPNRKYAFEPALTADSKKASTGFADLAFWAAHLEAKTGAKGTLNRALYSHKLVQSWVPKFESWGIKGSIEGETKKYMTWKLILATSAKEIAKMKGGQ